MKINGWKMMEVDSLSYHLGFGIFLEAFGC